MSPWSGLLDAAQAPRAVVATTVACTKQPDHSVVAPLRLVVRPMSSSKADQVNMRIRPEVKVAVVVVGVVICALAWPRHHAAGAMVELAIVATGKEFALADAMTANWDRVHVFHPYDTARFIDESLGFPWPQSAETGLEFSEGHSVLVFVDGQRVVSWAKVPRDEFEFKVDKPGRSVARGDAVFVIERRPGQPTILRCAAPSARGR